ncbi:MAG: Rieske 2Fe-2S domain-containing protein, partial [Cyanobacteria bacterium J06649_4]
MKRRDFLNWIGVSTLAASLPVAIAACTPTDETITDESVADESAVSDGAPSDGGNVAAETFSSVGTTTELAAQGYLLNEDALEEPVIVIEDPTNPDGLIALNAKCTHTGCTVAWQEDLFACPCHGSKFNPDGSVV